MTILQRLTKSLALTTPAKNPSEWRSANRKPTKQTYACRLSQEGTRGCIKLRLLTLRGWKRGVNNYVQKGIVRESKS